MASIAAVLVGRGLRLGPMRFTSYGVCAASGVIAAMTLSGRAARRVGLGTDVAWDAGLFAVICCFAASRLLLVLGDVKAFMRYPLVVLGLPSLTVGGMALAAVAVWVYLRHRRVPALSMLDAFAPGGAVLAACLELGHAMDGSEPGMPMALPWSMSLRGGNLHRYPVAMDGSAVAVFLAAALWLLLGRPRRSPGRVTALGLAVGGALAFALDLITLPGDLFGTLPLEPGQLTALTAMLAGALLWTFAPEAQAACDPVTARIPRLPAGDEER